MNKSEPRRSSRLASKNSEPNKIGDIPIEENNGDSNFKRTFIQTQSKQSQKNKQSILSREDLPRNL
jgi:hypothetical protein